MQKLLLVLIVFVIIYVPAKAQEGAESFIEDLLEELPDDQESYQYSQLMEDLQAYLQNPININTAERQQLAQLHVLSDYQINQILNYRESYGALISIYEFLAIDGIDKTLAMKLQPFFTFTTERTDDLRLKYAWRYGGHDLFLRAEGTVEQPVGYRGEDSYPGNRMKYYTRYQYNYQRRIQMGLVAEKDPGEQFFKGAQSAGFDHYAAHMELTGIGPFNTIVLGDFQGQFGQGLVLSSGFRNGKSPYVLNTSKQVQGLSKYSSSNENQFFRGAGFVASWQDWQFTAFASRKRVDANIEGDSVVASLPNTGIHATASQVERKDALQESVIGGQINWHGQWLKTGASALASRFELPLAKPSAGEIQEYDFAGSTSLNAGVHYRSTLSQMHFYGETAINRNKAWASVNGMLLPVTGHLAVSLVYRNYQPAYNTLYGGAFGEQSGVQNEEGLYMGLQFHPVAGLKVAGYADHYSFPWLSYRKSAPANGSEYFLEGVYTPSSDFEASIRFKTEQEQENLTTAAQEQGIKQLVDKQKGYVRYNQTYELSEQVELENRVHWAFYEKGGERSRGWMLYQDIRYKLPSFPLQLDARLAAYNTDNYQTRMYAYEHDVLYAFSVPAYYGKGMRTYLLAKYEPTERLSAWLKVSQSFWTDRQEVGSGKNAIEGPTKTRVRLQLRYSL